MSSTLTWSEKFNCGHSDECYFGSLPTQKRVIMVYSSFTAGKPAWRIMFNDGSLRHAVVESHPTLEAVKVYAEACLSQPICERGYRSLANNAALIASRLCGPCDSSADIAAAIEIAHGEYPSARIADIRSVMARRFAGGGFQRAA